MLFRAEAEQWYGRRTVRRGILGQNNSGPIPDLQTPLSTREALSSNVPSLLRRKAA